MRRALTGLLVVTAVGSFGGCNDQPATPGHCAGAPGTAPLLDPDLGPCPDLSSHRFFVGFEANGRPIFNEGVVPFDVNTPLFTDYTLKIRGLYVPPGSAPAHFPEGDEAAMDRPLDLPVGSVLLKTFAAPRDLRDPSAPVDVIETRLLVRTSAGWRAHTYIWKEDRSDAFHEPIGRAGIELEWVHTDGERRSTTDYLIPSERECRNCHGEGQAGLRPLGLRAPQLAGRDALGALVSANLVEPPAGPPAEAFPIWNPDGTPSLPLDGMDGETLDRHARAYLDANCSSCHQPGGNTRGAGLDLRFHVVDPQKLGVCKVPSAAGSEAQGGRSYDVVPGAPDASVMLFRMESRHTDADHANRRMPPRGRSLPHDEGVLLVRRWIGWLGTPQGLDRYPGLAERSCR
jgi:uncharacterized repeat protein (TIGR03806 family)